MPGMQSVCSHLIFLIQPYFRRNWLLAGWLVLGFGCCIAPSLHAQTITLSGRVTDALTGQPLADASVAVAETEEGTATDAEGTYRLTLSSLTTHIRISHIGFVTAHVQIQPGRTRYDIALSPITASLDEITVRAGAIQDRLQRAQMGVLSLPAQTLANIPSLGGERDVLRAIQALPGIRANNDLSIGYHVRGGTASQNLVLLDGIPVYNPWHLFGFFSAFNVDALETVHLMKGAFPAEYGGRLSSVLVLDLKERTPDATEGRFTISTISAQGVVYGTGLQKRLRWMVAARRSYLDPLLWLFSQRGSRATQGSDVSLGYVMGDFNTKLTYEATPTLQLSGSLFAGQDRMKGMARRPDDAHDLPVVPIDEDRGHYGWRNLAGRLAVRRTFSDRLVATLSGYVTRHSFGTGTGYINHRSATRTDSLDYSYGIRFHDWNVRLSNDWQLHNHIFLFGGEVTRHAFSDHVRLGYNIIDPDLDRAAIRLDSLVQSQPSDEAALFLQDAWDVTPRLRIQPSLRWSFFRSRGNESAWYSALEPRFDARFLLRDRLKLKAGAAVTQQYLQQATDELLVLPFDRWVPASAKIPPARAWQLAAGVEAAIGASYYLDVEVYYRHLDGLLHFSALAERNLRESLDLGGIYDDDAALVTRFGPFPRDFVFGIGESYGVDVFLERRAVRLTGTLGYSLSWAYQQFDDLNQGQPFPAFYDRRHDLTLTGLYRFTERLRLSGSWTFQTGAPLDFAIGYYDFYGHPATTPNQAFIFGGEITDWQQFTSRNRYRLPSYHRLDAALTWQSRFLQSLNGEGGRWTFSVYNLYNRINPITLIARNGEQSTEDEPATAPHLLKLGVLPIVPSLALTFEF